MNKKLTTTTDMGLVCALSTVGFPVHSTVRDSSSKITFCFKDSEEIQQAINQYWNRQLLVDAYELMSVQRGIKARIRSI